MVNYFSCSVVKTISQLAVWSFSFQTKLCSAQSVDGVLNNLTILSFFIDFLIGSEIDVPISVHHPGASNGPRGLSISHINLTSSLIREPHVMSVITNLPSVILLSLVSNSNVMI